jgi:hypothetical protein
MMATRFRLSRLFIACRTAESNNLNETGSATAVTRITLGAEWKRDFLQMRRETLLYLSGGVPAKRLLFSQRA